MASHPYHAQASIWNPVSRNDSEIQSQSSGAMGGDTTDDGNYSSFTDLSSTFSEQAAIRSREEVKHKRLKEKLKKEQDMKRSAEQNQGLELPMSNQTKFRSANLSQMPPSKEFFNQVKSKLLVISFL